MKAGLATSVAAHVLVLGWGLVSLSSPSQFNAEITEALPVSLVPIGDEMSIQKGELTAPKGEKPAPKPTTKPQEKPDAQHVGDGKVDSAAPLKPKEKDREVEATPPLSGDKDGKPEIVPPTKTPDTKPTETPKPEEAVKPEAPAKQEEAPKPTEAAPEKPAENPDTLKPKEEAKADPMPKLPEKAPLPKPKPAAEKAATPKPKGEESVDDILAMNQQALIDKTRTSGGGAARSQGPAAFGGQKNIGNGDTMTQTVINVVTSCIESQLKLVAIGGGVLSDRPVVKVRFNLNAQGMVVGEPSVTGVSGDPNKQALLSNQTRAAVMTCQPYNDLPRDRFDLWGQGFELDIDPLRPR